MVIAWHEVAYMNAGIVHKFGINTRAHRIHGMSECVCLVCVCITYDVNTFVCARARSHVSMRVCLCLIAHATIEAAAAAAAATAAATDDDHHDTTPHHPSRALCNVSVCAHSIMFVFVYRVASRKTRCLVGNYNVEWGKKPLTIENSKILLHGVDGAFS